MKGWRGRAEATLVLLFVLCLGDLSSHSDDAIFDDSIVSIHNNITSAKILLVGEGEDTL